MIRKKQNKRASKYSLEQETDLTHFGKKIGDMTKSEIRQANIGSGDEQDEEPFSYDSLISKSKELRAAARRQKMEAEAELEDLDGSFKGLIPSLERRNMEKDRLLNGGIEDDNDLAFLARSFQMENVKKAMAGERSISAVEVQDRMNQIVRQSEAEKSAAANQNLEEEDDNEAAVIVESDSECLLDPILSTEKPAASTLFSSISDLLKNPDEIPTNRVKLVDLARSTSASEINEFFVNELFTPLASTTPMNSCHLLIVRIASILFPLDHLRHSIMVPALKLLETACFASTANMCHLILLADFLRAGPKYSPAFFSLAGRLYRNDPDSRNTIVSIASDICSKFTKESLFGPIQYFFPELLPLFSHSEEPFVPLRLHTFKPVEVLSLEPAFHEDGTEWNGQNKEIREAKKLDRKLKDEKRLTAKEMRREAAATESFFAIEKQKEKAKVDLARKRTIAKMQEAEDNFKLTKTDNGKVDDRKMKSNKKRRPNKK